MYNKYNIMESFFNLYTTNYFFYPLNCLYYIFMDIHKEYINYVEKINK